jgi:predicted metal-dependent hydrolase
MTDPQEFKKIVRKWAEMVGIPVREIHLRPMTRKWGSCSSRGRLTFDTGILRESEKKRAEIVLHELLHLKYPNHGKMFQVMLRTYLSSTIDEGPAGQKSCT